jgi:hypothetical protein
MKSGTPSFAIALASILSFRFQLAEIEEFPDSASKDLFEKIRTLKRKYNKFLKGLFDIT